MANEQNPMRINIGPVRFSFVHLFEPWKGEGASPDAKPKYSVKFMIPKANKALVAEINRAIEAAKQDGKTRLWGNKIPGGLDLPLQDGDLASDKYPEFAGHWLINAKSDQQPGVVGRDRKPIIEKDEVYSGMWGYGNVSFFAYNKINKGVGVALNHVMKVKDGEPFSTRISADAAFEGIEIDGESEFD